MAEKMEWLEELRKKAEIKRPSSKLMEEIRKLDVGLMYDGMRYAFGVHAHLKGIKPMFSFMRENKYVGPAITILMQATLDENPEILMKKMRESGRSREDCRLVAIDYAKPGDILVIGGYRMPEYLAPWGECFSTFAKRNKMQAVVIDAGVRDTMGVEKMKFPVFARGATCMGIYEFAEEIALNVPIMCGDVQVRPGDIIMGDGDGLIVIPPEYAKEALEYAKGKAERERMATEVYAPAGKPALESLPPGRPRVGDRSINQNQS